MHFHDLSRFLGKSGCVSHPPSPPKRTKFCARLLTPLPPEVLQAVTQRGHVAEQTLRAHLAAVVATGQVREPWSPPCSKFAEKQCSSPVDFKPGKLQDVTLTLDGFV